MTRRISVVLAIIMVAGSLAACGKQETRLDEVLAAVRKTQRAPHRFVYVDDRPANELSNEPAQEYRVLGLVEDDFRFKARAEVNGVPSFDEVVMDDLLAVRFIDPSRMGQLLDRNKLNDPTVKSETDVPGISVFDALAAKRWVIDPKGAPPITAAVRAEKELGGDPIVDSLTALSYVAQAARESAGVKKFDKNSVEPAYPQSEDNFPKPAKKETRYDLVRPRLPAISTTAGGAPAAGGQAAFPGTKHFRKMAIYVKDGLIIKVLEDIEVKGKFLDKVIKYVKKSVQQSESQDAIDGFDEFTKTVPKAQQGRAILQFLSFGLQSFGLDGIMVRNMSMNLLDFGADIKVDLPVDGVVNGSLAILRASAGSESTQTRPASGSTASTVVSGQGGSLSGSETVTTVAQTPTG